MRTCQSPFRSGPRPGALICAALWLTLWPMPGRRLARAEPDANSRTRPADGAVRCIKPKDIWKRFTIFVWQYKNKADRHLDLYRQAGFHAFHIDRGANKGHMVAFAKRHKMPYYVDHAADKGYLHLTNRTGRKKISRKRTVVARPNSLADPRTLAVLTGHLDRNIAVTRRGPVAAYSFDDEISLGVFNSPCEVDGSPLSVAGYRKWLTESYGTIDRLNRTWAARLTSFGQAQPVSFEAVRRAHGRGPFARWNLSRWMDWRSYMDSQLAGVLAALTRHANRLDPATPAGLTGGQQPAPYGGYDYAKICKAVQWMEAYDIGGTCEILRSLWSDPRRPYVQTWFSTGDARRDAWFLWYYLLHGNRGVIAWPAQGSKSWFAHSGRGLAPFIAENARTIREVQSAISEHILGPDVRFEADPIAVYYSHPSVQASWVMDAVTHRGTWPNRLSSLDNKCQSAGKNRVAWFKLLEDCGFQYNVVTAAQVAAGRLTRDGYRVLILNRVVAMSDREASAIREFAASGGMVIADHLTGVLNERGVGRAGGGALDEMFGIRRDERKGYLDGRHITEIDGELYRLPFLQRLKYKGAIRHEGIVVYERGTRADGGKAKAGAGGADVIIRRRAGKGRTAYLNLTNMAYYDMDLRMGAYGRQWRSLITDLLAEASLRPRGKVLAGGRPVPLAELVYWRKGNRLVIGLVKNPVRQGSISSAGKVHDVTGKAIDLQIVLRRPVRNIRDLRTGAALPDGNVISAKWKPSEALLFEVTCPPGHLQ